MKFLLLRVLLISRTKDRGFTLPMVIGIGLIMVLLSSISLVQSSEENLIAISKVQSSTSLAMAELGIARYRELLNNNRVLAVNSLDNWSAVATQTCDEISNAAGDWAYNDWVNNPNPDVNPGWRQVTIDETDPTPATDFNNDGDTTDTNIPIGSYRIVDYVYDNDGDVDTDENGDFDQTSDNANIGVDPDGAGPLTAPRPRGVLTVQGQDINGSVAQIQVTIPIGINTEDLNSLDPGIWIYKSSVANWGNLNFNSGNLVLDRDLVDPGDPSKDLCADLAIPMAAPLTTVTARRDPRNLLSLTDLEFPTDAADFNILPNNIADELLIGKPSAKSFTGTDGVDRYYYRVDGNLNIATGGSLVTDGTAKVIILINNGNLNIDGNVSITNSSGDATSRFLQIHVDGNVNITGDGNVNIKGLIHAPGDDVDTGVFDIAGNAIVNLTGSIWVDNWSSTGTVNVTSSDYKFYSITPNRTPKPLTFAPTGWEQQQTTN